MMERNLTSWPPSSLETPTLWWVLRASRDGGVAAIRGGDVGDCNNLEIFETRLFRRATQFAPLTQAY